MRKFSPIAISSRGTQTDEAPTLTATPRYHVSIDCPASATFFDLRMLVHTASASTGARLLLQMALKPLFRPKSTLELHGKKIYRTQVLYNYVGPCLLHEHSTHDFKFKYMNNLL
jgi:hypothetical protein